MTDLRKAAEMALDALNRSDYLGWQVNIPIIKALRQALAEPEQEPVAWINYNAATGEETINRDCHSELGSTPLYKTPPKREWVGLTDEEIIKCFDSVAFGQVEDDLIINKHVNIFRAIHGIEAKLKEKNT